MAKKEKISLNRSTDFHEVDTELSEAMQALEQTNARIDNLLGEFTPSENAGTDDTSPAESVDTAPPPSEQPSEQCEEADGKDAPPDASPASS